MKAKFELFEQPVSVLACDGTGHAAIVCIVCDSIHSIFNSTGKEWALSVQIDVNDRWVITTWKKKPSDKIVAFTEDLVLRAFEIYYNSINLECFKVKE